MKISAATRFCLSCGRWSRRYNFLHASPSSSLRSQISKKTNCKSFGVHLLGQIKLQSEDIQIQTKLCTWQMISGFVLIYSCFQSDFFLALKCVIIFIKSSPKGWALLHKRVAFIQAKGQPNYPFTRFCMCCPFLLGLAVWSYFGADQGTSKLQRLPNLVLEVVLLINYVLTPHFVSLQVKWVS